LDESSGEKGLLTPFLHMMRKNKILSKDIVYEAVRSFVTKYYTEDLELFELLWNARGSDLEQLTRNRNALSSFLVAVGFGKSETSADLLLRCCATFSEFFLKVSEKVSESEERLPKFKLRKLLERVERLNKIKEPLRSQIIEYLIPFTEKALDSLEELHAVLTESRKRVVIIDGRRDSMTETEIEGNLRSRTFDLFVDEDRYNVFIKGELVKLRHKAIDVLAALLRFFSTTCKYEEILRLAWNESAEKDASQELADYQKKKIQVQVEDELKKRNNVLRDAIESEPGVGYRIKKTPDLKSYFLATKEPAMESQR